MNKKDREAITKHVEALTALKDEAISIGSAIQDMADAEREKLDNLSEGLQQAEVGQKIEQAADALDAAAAYADGGDLDSAINELEGLASD